MPTANELSAMMAERFKPEKAQGVNAIIQFDLTGENGGDFYIHINDGDLSVSEGHADDPKMTLRASADDYYNMWAGDLNPMQAFMSGKVKIQGDMGLAMKLQSMFDFS